MRAQIVLPHGQSDCVNILFIIIIFFWLVLVLFLYHIRHYNSNFYFLVVLVCFIDSKDANGWDSMLVCDLY